MPKKPAKKPAPKHPIPKTLTHQVRIIGGIWKRTPLPVMNTEGLRPTPDRVRETVFNWINHLLDGAWGSVTCLDLFAGTGALGFEAASRGAASVLMIEENTPAVRQLEMTKEKLHADQVTIMRGDALTLAQGMVARNGDQHPGLDLIFLDPPFQQGLLAKILPLCAQLLAKNGLVYAEAELSLDVETPPDWLIDWEVVRADKAGMVHYHLLRRRNSA